MKPIFLVLGLIALGLLAWLGYANYTVVRDGQAGQRLERTGVVSEARLVWSGQTNTGRSTFYRVRLTFTPQGGAPQVVERRVDFATFSTLRGLGRGQVRYLPGAPQTAEVVGSSERGSTALSVIALDLLVLGFIVWAVWMARRSP